jgi:hypothetical protein
MLARLFLTALVAGICFLIVHWLIRHTISLPFATSRLAHRHVFAKWQGRYYAFDGRQIRFCLIDDEVWIAEKDIFALIVPPPTPRELRVLAAERALIEEHHLMAISANGALRLLSNRTPRRGVARETLRLSNWLENEAIPNVRRFPDSSI